MIGVNAVVFDLGGVLFDWNPRHLYRRVFGGDEAAMERFLGEVCTSAWNIELDRGQSFAEAVAVLQAEHPAEAERFDLTPERTLFIDDVAENVAGAESVGFIGHHFTGAAVLRARLTARGLVSG